MMDNPSGVNVTDFINGSANANGTVLSIPANRYFSVDIQMSAVQAAVGSFTAKVTLTNTSTAGTFSPANNSTVAQLVCSGLLAAVGNPTSTTELAGFSGDTGCSLVFATGGGTANCTINGFMI